MKVPQKIIDAVLAKTGKYPVALTGCRTTDLALECCEYDFVIITDDQYKDLLQVGGDYAELHTMPQKSSQFEMALNLHNMQIINDSSWILSSLKQGSESIAGALLWYSRNKAVDALLYANRSMETTDDSAAMSSLWLKCAAYCYLEAAISRSGAIPMPVHMLAQLRTIEDRTVTEGISLASNCLGLERANKSSLSRCVEATIGLNDKIKHDYTTKLVSKKAKFMYDATMYADCYFYVGYVARNAVMNISANQKLLKDYAFMIGIAMDLTTDQSFVLRFSGQLLDACNMLLKK